ncbi:MAG: hypothetical protein QOH52_3723 [Pseudonocardiales bacterium]|nr:hypothetical protein [Pseudonocardiales bacterium]
MEIIPATLDEATDIATVHVRSWQRAYRDVLPPDFLCALDPAQRAQGWRRVLAATNLPGEGALLARVGEKTVGFVHTCPSRDEDARDASVGEVTSIYVLPQAWGRGVGRGLMTAALSQLAAAGYGQATLWVIDSNTRAIAFYEAGGFRADAATQVETVGGTSITEVRYRCPLP